MQKRISFFDVIYKIVVQTGMMISIFSLALILVSFTYFNHKEKKIELISQIEIYQKESIVEFSAHVKRNELHLVVVFDSNKTDKYLLQYAYYYYNLYEYVIYLEADIGVDVKYVTVTLEGISSIS